MSKFQLKINSKVEINLEESIFASTIQDVKEESFFISIPMEKGNYIKFEENQKLEIYNYFENVSMYKFECKVIGRSRCGNTPLYELSKPEKVIKIQRREFFRVDIIAPIKIKAKNNNKIPALLLDLSGGGLRLKTTEKFAENEIIEIHLVSTDTKKALDIQGEIVRTERDKEGKYIYGVSFYKMENKVREKIIQAIFTVMRAQKKPK